MECGETWHRLASTGAAVANLPQHGETWLGIARLALTLLDPLVDRFGPVELTYAFASQGLTRHIKRRIAPALDQHAGSELRKDGRPVCPRGGQAVDFRIAGAEPGEIAAFIAATVPFDRLYLYDGSDVVHCSVGPEASKQIVKMVLTDSGRLVPRVLRSGR